MLRRTVLSLALGLLTTIAVAWMAALFANPVGGGWFSRPRDPRRGEGSGYIFLWVMKCPTGVAYRSSISSVERERPDDLPGLPEDQLEPWALSPSLPWVTGDSPWPIAPGTPVEEIVVEGFGWPRTSLCQQFRGAPQDADRPLIGGIETGFPNNYRGNAWPWQRKWHRWVCWVRVALPCKPVWTGLAFSTAFYSGLWLLLFCAPALSRRTLRRRRGLCPRCAYDLKGLPPASTCPECGTQS